MKIQEEYIGYSKVKYILEYEDCYDFSILPYEKCSQVYTVCFIEDKIIIGYGGHKNTWGLIGGTIESGETFEQTLIREVQEESNVKLLKMLPIGYQKVTDTRDNSFVYQLRYVSCGTPYGSFVSDPAGSITKIDFINPSDYKKYFDWGKIGERIMQRALELRDQL